MNEHRQHRLERCTGWQRLVGRYREQLERHDTAHNERRRQQCWPGCERTAGSSAFAAENPGFGKTREKAYQRTVIDAIVEAVDYTILLERPVAVRVMDKALTSVGGTTDIVRHDDY